MMLAETPFQYDLSR